VQHPFTVTVTPEGGQAISLDGTFTQLPVFARWARVAAISAGAVAVTALLVWLGAVVLGGALRGGEPVGSTPSATPSVTPSETPPPEPDVSMVVSSTVDDTVQAGDPVVFSLEPAVEEAPGDSLLAMEVEWPEGLLLTGDECEAWVAPDTDGVLEGRPQSGDECVIDLSGGGNDAGLTFATPPAGFAGAVSARATRLVTLDDREAATLETGSDSDFGTVAEAEIALAPYPFWLEVVDLPPSDGGPDATVVIHHVMRGDGTDEEATMAFEIVPPAFVDRIRYPERCNSFEDSICSVYFSSDADDPTNTRWEIELWFDPDDARGIGSLSVTGTSLTDVASNEVGDAIRGAEGLVVSEHMFDVDVRLDSDGETGQGESVTATVDVLAVEPPAAFTTYPEGSLTLGLELAWPGGLEPVGPPVGCATLADRLCTVPGPSPGKPTTITMRFVVDDPFDAGEIGASGVTLSYDPTTTADERDGRTKPPVSLPQHWIGSDAEQLPF
jgi:hypothetical protein